MNESTTFFLRCSWGAVLCGALSCSSEEEPLDKGSQETGGTAQYPSGGEASGGATGGDTMTAGGTTPSDGGTGPASGGTAEHSGGMGAVPMAGGMGGVGDSLFVPTDIPIRNRLENAEDSVRIVASTLLDGEEGIEFYAAVRNEGTTQACDLALTAEFFDQEGISLEAVINGVHGGQMYRHGDGSPGLLACLGPDDLAMTKISGLSPAIQVADLGGVVYQFAFFNEGFFPFELIPEDGLQLREMTLERGEAGDRVRGRYENGLELFVNMPRVTVYFLNEEGRPIGAAESSSAVNLAPGDSWDFATPALDRRSEDFIAYPGGSVQF